MLLSAVIHALWNLQLKRSHDKTIFSYIYVWSAILFYTPVFIIMLPGAVLPWEGLVAAISTGVIYCFYFLLLARSYSRGDLSLSYPIARGAAPVLTLIWAVVFLGERPSTTGIIGIILIVVAIFTLHIPEMPGKGFRKLLPSATAAALGTGLSISLYSTVDKIGVSFIAPYLYIYLTFLIGGILLTPFYLGRYGYHAIVEELRLEWKRAVLVGILSIYGYLLVLFAMGLTQVSYIIPLRSTSILFAVIFGFEVLGEEKSAMKTAAALSMIIGVLFIALS